MKNKDCDIPFPIKALGWFLISFVILYFYKEFLEYPDVKSFTEGQGSFLGAVVGAVVLTGTVAFTIKKQAESVERQIASARANVEAQIFSDRADEMSYLALEINAIILNIYELLRGSIDAGGELGKLSAISGMKLNRLESINKRVKVLPDGLVFSYKCTCTLISTLFMSRDSHASLSFSFYSIEQQLNNNPKDCYSEATILSIGLCQKEIRQPITTVKINNIMEILHVRFYELHKDIEVMVSKAEFFQNKEC